jgi:ATP-dependent helicase YprA (DUF1998 family)
MTALDALLDARVTDSEIALWLEISEQAVRLRRISREREAIRSSRRPVLALPCESASGPSVSGKTHSQPLALGSVTP